MITVTIIIIKRTHIHGFPHPPTNPDVHTRLKICVRVYMYIIYSFNHYLNNNNFGFDRGFENRIDFLGPVLSTPGSIITVYKRSLDVRISFNVSPVVCFDRE